MEKTVNREKADVDFTALLNTALEQNRSKRNKRLATQESAAGDIQARREEGRAATTWYITPEQLERMNDGERQATDDFFNDNHSHLYFLALSILRRMGCLENSQKKKLLEIDDLINQAYVDIRSGFIVFKYSRLSITKSIARSMRFAPVGGVDPTKEYQYKGRVTQ